MIWQDLLFTVGGVIFIVALLPSVFSEDKPPLSSCLTTGTVLIAFGAAYLTLGLHFAAVTTFLSGGVWLTIAEQQWKRTREKKRLQKKIIEGLKTNHGRVLPFLRHESRHGVGRTLYTDLDNGETFYIEHAIDPYHDGYHRVYETRDEPVFYPTWEAVIDNCWTDPLPGQFVRGL